MKSIEPCRLFQDAFVYVICATPIAILRVWAEPYHRGFYCDDESIRYPNLPSTISTVALILVGVIVPLSIILIIEIYRLYKIEPRLYGSTRILNGSTVTVDIPTTLTPIVQGAYIGDRLIHPLIIRYFTYAGAFLFGASMCEVLTDIGKILIGELRPHFIEACQPDWSLINCSDHRYVIDYVCQTKNLSTLREARQSFPSGHASFAAYCACFTVLYLRNRAAWPLSPATGRLIRPCLQYVLILTAFVTGLTRIANNQHHCMDVGFGFALGAVTAGAVCYHFEIWGTRNKASGGFGASGGNWTSVPISKKESCAIDIRDDKETTGLLYSD